MNTFLLALPVALFISWAIIEISRDRETENMLEDWGKVIKENRKLREMKQTKEVKKKRKENLYKSVNYSSKFSKKRDSWMI